MSEHSDREHSRHPADEPTREQPAIRAEPTAPIPAIKPTPPIPKHPRIRRDPYRRFLAPGEEEIERVRPHAVQRLWVPVVILLGALVVATILSAPTGLIGAFTDFLAGLVFLAALGNLVFRVVIWWVERYLVTSVRVLLVEGIVVRKVHSMPINKITDTTLRETPLGKVFGYSDLLLDTPGQKPGLQELTGLPDRERIYKVIVGLASKMVPQRKAGL